MDSKKLLKNSFLEKGKAFSLEGLGIITQFPGCDAVNLGLWGTRLWRRVVKESWISTRSRSRGGRGRVKAPNSGDIPSEHFAQCLNDNGFTLAQIGQARCMKWTTYFLRFWGDDEINEEKAARTFISSDIFSWECGHCQIQADVGMFGMIEWPKHVQQ